MEGNIIFYTYGTNIELNGTVFSAGELTADLLNLSAEDYARILERFSRAHELGEQLKRNCNDEIYQECAKEISSVKSMLRNYAVFKILLAKEVNRSFSEEQDYPPEFWEFLLAGSDSESYTEEKNRWIRESAKQEIDLLGRYLHDISAFVPTIRNFINFILAKLENNNPEEYARALYFFYNDPRLAEKLIVNPFQGGAACYTVHDSSMLSYVPRALPDGRFVISQEHVTDSLQALMKADYMLALNCGYNIHGCFICGTYFLVRSGAHTLYCEGPCPHAPRFTCRQFGTHEVQKELSRDIPKVRIKQTAFERITKDMQRGNISREDSRRAKDYVRDKLYDALRNSNVSAEEFERSITQEQVYSTCGITRISKPRGRPRKQTDGEDQ